MIKDVDSNIVYLADSLKKEKKDVYKRLTALLNKLDIRWKLIPGTKDIWARDYMPLQLKRNDFLLYRYDPDYLNNEEYKGSITDASIPCEKLGFNCRTTPIKIDGGNVVICGDYIVMTNKVFSENGCKDNDPRLIAELEALFGHEIIFIPWHCLDPDDEHADVYGHADGFVRWCGGRKVLMSNHRDSDKKEALQIKARLEEKGFDVTEMLFHDIPKQDLDYNWAYINYLQVGHKIIVPAVGNPEDKLALKYIREANSDCEITPFRMKDIVSDGGALHCITWNILE
ncbi:MAG: agmatine deiminase family protein [Prevotella sp.]|nr:agmatine deiminase family protein [Prevotella sp.]